LVLASTAVLGSRTEAYGEVQDLLLPEEPEESHGNLRILGSSAIRMIKSMSMILAEHVARTGMSVGEQGGKRPLGRTRSRWVVNIKTGLDYSGSGCRQTEGPRERGHTGSLLKRTELLAVSYRHVRKA
jgi:hypothetical protein